LPIQQTQGVFSTGRDCTIVLIHPVYGQVQLDNVTGFDAKQEVVKLKSRRLDGVKLNADLPDGWTGSLEVDRGSEALDVTEVGGAQTVWVYDNVAMSLADGGKWQSDAITKQRLDFTANRRRQM
jgi:hypothetical protein